MRSFAVIAGFAAAANALAYGYPEAYNTTSSALPYPEYPASSAAAEYTTTKVIVGLTTVCSEATTLTYAGTTFPVSASTTLTVSDVTTTSTYVVKPTASASAAAPEYTTSVAGKPSATHYAPSAYSSAPAAPVAPVPYPSAGNGTTPHPTGVSPSGTKPASPEFTGAASHAGVGLLAAIGAVAAFL